MRQIALMNALMFVFVLGAAGCPDRKEAIDEVGGAPKAQVDAAKERLGIAEDRMKGNAEAVNAAAE